MIPVSLKRNALRHMKHEAPYDTGNLRHNAIYGQKWSDKNKFQIVLDLQSATYLEPLYEGWTNKKTGVKYEGNKFIDRAVWLIIRDFTNYYEKGSFKKRKGFSRQELTDDMHRIGRHAQSLSLWRSINDSNKFKANSNGEVTAYVNR